MIKFRVWDHKNESFWHNITGVTNHGIILTAEGNPGLVTDITNPLDPNKKCYYFDKKYLIIQQFIGLQDISGKDIYEGDILEVKCLMQLNGGIGYVVYEDCQFNVINKNRTFIRSMGIYCNLKYRDKIIIIGNILENKELLNEDRD